MSANRLSKNKLGGYSRREIVLVLGVILVVAFVSIPILSKSSKRSELSLAMEHEKQIFQAGALYSENHNGALVKEYFGFPSPPACNFLTSDMIPPGTFYNWRYLYLPYLKNGLDSFTDPTNPFRGRRFWTEAWEGRGKAKSVYVASNFAVNNSVIGFANGICGGPYTPSSMDNLHSIADPADTILYLPTRALYHDLKWHFGAVAFPGGVVSESDSHWCLPPSDGPELHLQAVCPALGNGPIHSVFHETSFVWADGHVKPKPYAATLMPSNGGRDEWAALTALNPLTGQHWSMNDEKQALSSLLPEYR